MKLSQSLMDLGLTLGRFKTGTPPRINRRSVDFSKMIEQPGDERPLRFSYISPFKTAGADILLADPQHPADSPDRHGQYPPGAYVYRGNQRPGPALLPLV